MEVKEVYKEFCQENNVPIFSQWWWLDTVCEKWDVILYEKGGKIWGSFPFCYETKMGFKIIKMPKLTQTLGPFILYPKNQKYYKKISWEIEIMDYFICNLPKFDYFNLNFHKTITNWLPFYWANFKQTTRYTYVIRKNNSKNPLEIAENDVRRRIKKAKKEGVYIEESEDVESLYKLATETFKRKGKELPYAFGLLNALFSSSYSRGKSKIMFANWNGMKIAGAMFVWDNEDVYYLVGGIHPKYKNLGGMDLILHEGILFALNNHKNFDFEGSMIKSIERYFRSFGAIQIPYFNIYRSNSHIISFYLYVNESLRRTN